MGLLFRQRVSFNKIVSADYAILNWENSQWNVKLFSEPYNIDELRLEFKSSGLLEPCFIWGKLILESLINCRNKNIEFINLALTIMDNKGLK